MDKKKIPSLPDFKPNKGIEVWYKKQLQSIVKEISGDIRDEVLAPYRRSVRYAMDSALEGVGHAVDGLVDRWSDKLLMLGKKISKEMFKRSNANYDREFKRALRKHGFTVNLQMTEYTEKAARDAVAMNTALIRSIGNQYLEKVQTHVWEAVGSGLDAGLLAKNLKHDFDVADRRAKNIARDQISKVNTAIEHARREEVGIKEAIWLHTGGGKEPRQSHIKANGKRYDVSKGLKIDGKYVYPGEEINCKCTSRAVLPLHENGTIALKNVQRIST